MTDVRQTARGQKKVGLKSKSWLICSVRNPGMDNSKIFMDVISLDFH